jgi:hypothetical protein
MNDSAAIEQRGREGREATQATGDVKELTRALAELVETAEQSRVTSNAQRMIEEARRLVDRAETPDTAQPEVPSVSRGDDDDNDLTEGAPALPTNDASGHGAALLGTGGEPLSDAPRPIASPDDPNLSETQSQPAEEQSTSPAADDLESAMAATTTNHAADIPRTVVPAKEVLETIEKLGELNRQGILTDEEYREKKADLLKRL